MVGFATPGRVGLGECLARPGRQIRIVARRHIPSARPVGLRQRLSLVVLPVTMAEYVGTRMAVTLRSRQSEVRERPDRRLHCCSRGLLRQVLGA
jgi:hypothetical protein